MNDSTNAYPLSPSDTTPVNDLFGQIAGALGNAVGNIANNAIAQGTAAANAAIGTPPPATVTTAPAGMSQNMKMFLGVGVLVLAGLVIYREMKK